MSASTPRATGTAGGDVVLQEVWQAKDTLSAAYSHDLKRLFEEARQRQKRSGHRIVDFSRRPTTTDR
jgi:hypothetical protein